MMFNVCLRGAKSSSPRELPSQALTEPYVNLSIHTALIIQPLSNTDANVQIGVGWPSEHIEATLPHGVFYAIACTYVVPNG